MPRRKKNIVEFRSYDLPAYFPVLLLTGDHWRISDVPSKRLHIHNCLEIGFCESDSGIMGFEDKTCKFQAGDVTVISCDIPHTTYSAPGTSSKWSYLFVDVAQLFQPLFPGTDLKTFELLSVTEHNLSYILGKDEYPVINSLVLQIIDELKEKKANYEISVRGLFLALVTNLMRISTTVHTKKESQPENVLVIAPALEYIRYHYAEDFPMELLAQLCGLSPTHFRRLFSSIIGESPLEHLHAVRIQKAADLLRMTEDSVLVISEKVGFHTLSSFNRKFLAIMNTTPREWRHKMSFLKDQSILKHNGWMFAEALKKGDSEQH